MENIDNLIEKYYDKAVQDMQDLIKINYQLDRDTIDD